MEINKNHSASPAFGIAKLKSLSKKGWDFSTSDLEFICTKCPGFDEFTHNYEVSLRAESSFYQLNINEGLFNDGIPNGYVRSFDINLAVKEKADTLLEKIKNLFKAPTILKYYKIERVKEGEKSNMYLKKHLLEEFRQKTMADFKEALADKKGEPARSKAQRQKKRDELEELRKLTR